MPRVKCENKLCKFNDFEGKCSKKSIIIGVKGCDSFEKNMSYYISLVWNELENTNMIFPFNLTPDLRIGLYYTMELFGLKYKYNTWGNDSFITLHRDDVKDGTALTGSDLVGIPMDDDKWHYHYEKFAKGLLPPYEDEKEKSKKKNEKKSEKNTKPKVESQPYGWLSPTGEFIESDWGTHEQSAIEIVKKNHWEYEYDKWYMEGNFTDDKRLYCRDFIIKEKGYALIHDPSLYGGYKVLYIKPLTKKQKDFLYGYFVDMGDYLTGEQYLEEGGI